MISLNENVNPTQCMMSRFIINTVDLKLYKAQKNTDGIVCNWRVQQTWFDDLKSEIPILFFAD